MTLRPVQQRILSQWLFFAAFVGFAFYPALLPGGEPFFRFNLASVSMAALATATLIAALAFVAVLVVTTFLFGRLFCGWACPLGAMSDFLDYLFRFPTRGEKLQHLKYCLLLVCVVAAAMGTSIVWLLDPLSWATQILDLGLARSSGNLWLSLLVLLVFLGLHWLFGRRAFCRILCPLGASLGLIARFSLYKRALDNDKCTDCNLCVTNNRSFAIAQNPRIYNSAECFQCRQCEDVCPTQALSFHYIRRRPGRRIHVQQVP